LGHTIILNRDFLWDVYFLFSIEEQLYNIETAQIFKELSAFQVKGFMVNAVMSGPWVKAIPEPISLRDGDSSSVCLQLDMQSWCWPACYTWQHSTTHC